METRTTQTEAIFRKPFQLAGMESKQPPGAYKISLVEEQFDTLSVIGWRQIAISLQILRDGVIEQVAIDPQDLRAALERDAETTAPNETGAMTALPRRRTLHLGQARR